MSKREYLDRLREFMSYELPKRLVDSNIQFYENYFEEQLKAGKSFQEIEEELGDPQLIARSCIDAAKSGADGIPNSGDDPDFAGEIEKEKNSSQTNDSQKSQNTGKTGNIHVISGGGCLLILLLIVVVIFFLFSSLLASPLGGVLLIVLAVAAVGSLLSKIFRK